MISSETFVRPPYPASQIGSSGVMSTLAAPAFHPPWPVDGMEATSNAVANNNPRASHLPFAVRPAASIAPPGLRTRLERDVKAILRGSPRPAYSDEVSQTVPAVVSQTMSAEVSQTAP